jgi:hypothetical protein
VNRARVAVRVLVVVLLLGAAVTLVSGYAASLSGQEGDVTAEGQSVASPADGMTVVATDSNTWLGREGEGPRATAALFAVDSEGTVQYFNDTHTRYWDVDPVEGEPMAVEYVYADHLTPAQCGGEEACTRNGIERVNLETGEVTAIYSRVTPGKHSTRWHDADRLDEDHFVVADIERDRVYIVNTTSGIETWSWDAQNAFGTATSGGPYPEDWTHLNDVEVLDDGIIMASVRNHDQVVFLDRETGLIENRTLGSDDDHSVLYEQHNPDYIPAENGGPAVIVADSERNRVIEYQRDGDGWTQSWTWRDGRLQWPRDADRLPNGHTLITDSNGNRVFEVDREGKIVWSLDVAFPYEAERLETGDESAGGPSAREAGLASKTDASGGGEDAFEARTVGPKAQLNGFLSNVFDGPRANAVMYVLPVWMTRTDLLALVMLVVVPLVWGALELYWRGWSVEFHSPIDLRRNP